MTRVVWHAKLVEQFKDAGDCVHEFTGDLDDGGEWITPADALRGVALSIWNAVEGMTESASDRFELGVGLAYVPESRASVPEVSSTRKGTAS